MDVDGAEAPCKGIEGGPSCSRSIGKPASYFLEKADECFASFPPNSVLAVKFLEKGVSVHPNNVELLQRLAGEYAEAGKIEEAKGMLKKALELEVRRLLHGHRSVFLQAFPRQSICSSIPAGRVLQE